MAQRETANLELLQERSSRGPNSAAGLTALKEQDRARPLPSLPHLNANIYQYYKIKNRKTKVKPHFTKGD